MKKFFTIIPLQIRGQLQTAHYIPTGNSLLDMEGEIAFPILAAINGYAQPGEEIRVIAIATDTDYTVPSRERFVKDTETLCEKKGVLLPRGVEVIVVPDDPSVNGQIGVFSRLIKEVEDNDELFSCMTFGTKPLSMALTMAIHYAYRIKKNASISCLVYGEVDRSSNPYVYRIYDMTALPQLDELVHTLAESKIEHPEQLIDALFHMGSQTDDDAPVC